VVSYIMCVAMCARTYIMRVALCARARAERARERSEYEIQFGIPTNVVSYVMTVAM